MNNLSHVLHRLALARGAAGLSDGQLLDCFLARDDAAAFEALVRRHGPMVLGVCRRVLHDPHDAEDAFQATFLVLVNKARSIVPREMVGNWLHGVAYRIALKAKYMRNRRFHTEKQTRQIPDAPAPPDLQAEELDPVLDQELNRLPEPYRAAIVLCDLEGRSRREVARQLNVPEGTVSSRLARARNMLREQLARLGITVTAGSLAGVLAQEAAAEVPPALVATTVKAAQLVAAGQAVAGLVSAEAAQLTQGLLKSMLLAKLKIALACGLLVSVLTVGGVLSHSVLLAEPDAPAPRAQANPAPRRVAAPTPSVAADVPRILERFKDHRPPDEALAVFQLDWAATLAEAKARAAKEQRPILFLVVNNSFGDLHSGHC